jgi:Ca2+/H+ antiporter
MLLYHIALKFSVKTHKNQFIEKKEKATLQINMFRLILT